MLEKRLEFTSKTGCQLTAFQQCIELPRAIATTDGQPVKGTKSNITKAYKKRYENARFPVIRTTLPPEWKVDTVVMEGMFLINIHHGVPTGTWGNMLIFYCDNTS